MRLSTQRVMSFQQKILTWWPAHRRDLPWRHTHDPYCIMVSEVMLQQTQVLRVIAKFSEFIEAFPTVIILAQASPAEVLRIWKGMGYNRRALYLQKAAKMIVEKFLTVIPAQAGIQPNIVVPSRPVMFPMSEKELLMLPGLGKYTARAVLVFAYGKEVPLVDTNIRRIITHFFFHDQPQKESVIENIARQLIPAGKSWQWHQALMDFGAIAMPNAKCQMLNKKKETIPFRQSNRFFRGRIIDRLREKDISETRLLRELGKTYVRPAAFFRSIIAGLVKDGLIERASRGLLCLPGG